MTQDSYSSPEMLAQAWRALGGQLAVMAGAAVALLSLFQATPVRIASMRGAITWGSLLLVTKVGAWFALRTWRAPLVVGEEGEEGEGQEALDPAA